MTTSDRPNGGSAVAPPAERPLRADAERNRRRILIAAQEVFAERGLEAPLDDIAVHAGVGVGTAYRRFANKEELIEALFSMRLDAMIEEAKECAVMPSAWDGLVRFLTVMCSAMSADRGFRDVLLRGDNGGQKAVRIRTRLEPPLADLVERAKAVGAVRPDFDPLDLPMMIVMMEAIADATDRIDAQLWERYLSLLLAGIRGDGMSAPALPGRPLTSEQVQQAMTNRHHRR